MARTAGISIKSNFRGARLGRTAYPKVGGK